MSGKDTIERCVGCGKPLTRGQKIKIITDGVVEMNGVQPFGKMHEACFTGSLDAPDAIMAQIRREAKKRTRKVAVQG